MSSESRILEPSDEDLKRVQTLLNRVGGRNVSWGAVSVLEVWLAEARLEADRLAAQRILYATWVLAVATIGLMLATAVLIFATLAS